MALARCGSCSSKNVDLEVQGDAIGTASGCTATAPLDPVYGVPLYYEVTAVCSDIGLSEKRTINVSGKSAHCMHVCLPCALIQRDTGETGTSRAEGRLLSMLQQLLRKQVGVRRQCREVARTEVEPPCGPGFQQRQDGQVAAQCPGQRVGED